MQFPHGVLRKASRNRISSLAFPQARVPPRNRRRCQEYNGLTASTPLECTYCEFRAQAKTGPLFLMRAREHSSTEPRSAPKKEALHKCPWYDRQAGNAGGLATHTRHSLSDDENVTKLKMEIK
ncbi:hypothetical protein TcCL_NonESM11325 [Trypanosoma cruzi]|nr:hypothetical protein TcCL_NonESM11325 [Trypanosoma cruzi]